MGGQREGCCLYPSDLAVLKRSEGLCWFTAEKDITFCKGVRGQRGKNRMAKCDLLANVLWLSMSSILLLPCSPMSEFLAFLRGETKTKAEAEKVQAGIVKASPHTFEMVWWLACLSFYM